MIGLQTRVTYRAYDRQLARASKKGQVEGLGHAAGAVMRTARALIVRRADPSKHSPPGVAPYTHTNKLKRAILYAVDEYRTRAVIGPSYDRVGTAGEPHEHGGNYRGVYFPRRPFMAPALDINRPRLPRHWAGVIRN